MSKNGLDVLEANNEQLQALRHDVLAGERVAWLREREALTIRARVQRRIGAETTTLDAIEKALEQCERALIELDAIADEWGAP